MVGRLAVLAAVLVCVAGCVRRRPARSSAFLDGTSVHPINVGGLERTYRLYKPPGLPASAPLAVMLHGGFGNGAQAEEHTAETHWPTPPSSRWPIPTASTGPEALAILRVTRRVTQYYVSCAVVEKM